MKIYICSIEGLKDAASYDAASLKIDSLRQEKVSRFKIQADRRRSLCAGLLLNYAVAQFKFMKTEPLPGEEVLGTGQTEGAMEDTLEDVLHIEELSVKQLLNTEKQAYDYRQDGFGKPYLADIPELQFNLSHSGDYVLCVWDLCEIGGDLQCMDREAGDILAKRVMTLKEYAHYMKLPECQRKAEFYRVWTIKESCCKLTGKGLSQDFRSIEIHNREKPDREKHDKKIHDREIQDEEQGICLSGEERRISFKAALWKEEYWLAVCHFDPDTE